MTPERSSGQPEGKVEPKHTSAQEPQSDAWLKTELARNVRRPYPMDFIRTIFVDLSEIHGDRNFADDPAMQCAKGVDLSSGAPF
jgi:acetyl-CoA carboxylase carboxyl transferase subunit alpha